MSVMGHLANPDLTGRSRPLYKMGRVDGMALPASDTTVEAATVYTAAFRSLTGGQRVERSIEMAEEVKQITLAGIAHRNPGFTPAEIHREWLRILHGESIAQLLV